MRLLEYADALDLDELSYRHATARGEDRKRVRAAVVARIIELEGDHTTLRSLGARLPELILEGTLQQRFCCKVASDFGLLQDVPQSVRREVFEPMIKALRVVLRVGAPATRDAAVEGIGALLKHFDDPAAALPRDDRLPVSRGENESDADFEARSEITDDYFDRLDRRRLMALTVAGHEPSRDDFARKLEEPMADVIGRIRREEDPVRKITYALWERSDFLRILPAVARQRRGRLERKPADLLVSAAESLTAEEGDPPEVVIAFARYRESVFRTVDAALRRGWKWGKFDDVVARAVRAIPQSVAGTPAMCNAEIRATVSIIRTAVRLLLRSKKDPSSTEAVLQPLFREELGREPSPWANHGIAEGCSRALPDLVGNPLYDEMTRPVLRALFEQTKDVPPADDLVKTHRRLVLSSCFRRILLSLVDHLYEQQLLEREGSARQDREQTDHDLHVLLHHPTAEYLLDICQHKGAVVMDPVPMDVAESVIAGIAFESDLLRRSAKLFERWPSLSTIEKVLLTRILAAQLHTLSRDRTKMRRHELLRRVFTETQGVSIDDDEALRFAWVLLSALPAEAADAADMEIQRFVEYRERKTGADRKTGEDLPGYVLAMISPVASGRIAGAIAREIDLKLRSDRGKAGADCAKTLYQVMLRGPHESIFDHLLPRLDDPDERSVVLLFRRHVGNVRRSSPNEKEVDLPQIVQHIGGFLKHLPHGGGKVLDGLRNALTLYRDLTAPSEDVWKLLAAGNAIKLFQLFDDLAAGTDHAQLRETLAERYEGPLSSLQDDVGHYITLPVGNFTARIDALRKARHTARELEVALDARTTLQPPERILLVALMQHFRGLFEATIRWACEEPRRRIDERAGYDKAKNEFWLSFCDPGSPDERIASLHSLVRSGEEDLDVNTQRVAQDRVTRFEQLIRSEPPRFPDQREKFEEFFVEWMASDLDVETLRKTLDCRWPPWFRLVYRTITSFLGMAIVVVLICGWSIAMDLLGYHSLEGASFFAASCVVLGAAVLSFIHGVRQLTRRVSGRPGYWFSSLLPRLARLTAVPMALIVEFDHSYEFPLCGSGWALLLLMMLSFLSTRFFVTREIVDQKERPGVSNVTKPEKKRVAQIVALALAHSFGIAVLLAAIFASSHPHKACEEHGTAPKHPAAHVSKGTHWIPALEIADAILNRIDEKPKDHLYSRFLGVLPRDVTLDLSQWLALPPTLEKHATFTFYPTIILTWTALGLFFGVFLEGFMGGKRLRGGEAKDRDSAH